MGGIPEIIGDVVGWVGDEVTDPAEWGTEDIMDDSYGWLDDVDYDYEFTGEDIIPDWIGDGDDTEAFIPDFVGDGDDTEAFIPDFVGDGDDTEAPISGVPGTGINIPKPIKDIGTGIIKNVGTGVIKNTLLPSNTSGGNVSTMNAAAAKAAADAAKAKAVRDATLFAALAAGSPPTQPPIIPVKKDKATYFSPYETDIFGNPNSRMKNTMVENETFGIPSTLKRKVNG